MKRIALSVSALLLVAGLSFLGGLAARGQVSADGTGRRHWLGPPTWDDLKLKDVPGWILSPADLDHCKDIFRPVVNPLEPLCSPDHGRPTCENVTVDRSMTVVYPTQQRGWRLVPPEKKEGDNH